MYLVPGKLVNKTPCQKVKHNCRIRAQAANLPTSSKAATTKGKDQKIDKVSYSPVSPVQGQKKVALT